MKILLSILLVIASILAGQAQPIANPGYENSDDVNTAILSVETNTKHTVITFEHTSPEANAWVQLNKSIYLQGDNGDKKFNYVKSESIPLLPAKHTFSAPNEKLVFKVYFEKLPAEIKKFDIIEKALPPGERSSTNTAFNFYGVSLERSTPQVVRSQELKEGTAQNFNPLGSSPNFAEAFMPMLGSMYSSMMSAQVEYFSKPGNIDALAKLNRSYFDALLKAGFTQDQAIKILTSSPLVSSSVLPQN